MYADFNDIECQFANSKLTVVSFIVARIMFFTFLVVAFLVFMKFMFAAIFLMITFLLFAIIEFVLFVMFIFVAFLVESSGVMAFLVVFLMAVVST